MTKVFFSHLLPSLFASSFFHQKKQTKMIRIRKKENVCIRQRWWRKNPEHITGKKESLAHIRNTVFERVLVLCISLFFIIGHNIKKISVWWIKNKINIIRCYLALQQYSGWRIELIFYDWIKILFFFCFFDHQTKMTMIFQKTLMHNRWQFSYIVTKTIVFGMFVLIISHNNNW